MFIAIFVVLAIFAGLDSYFGKNIFCYLSMIILVIVAGFRSVDTGFDTYNYYSDYNSVISGFTPVNSKEAGFVLLEKALAIFNSPTWLYFLFVAFLTFLLLQYGFSRLTTITAIPFLYYYSRFYLNRDLNQIRASLAAAIILCSLKFVAKRKLFPFLAVVLLATLIHSAACISIILYPCYILFYKLNNRGKRITYLILLILSVLLSHPISPYISNLNSDRLSPYVNNQFYIQGNGLSNPVIILQVILSVIGLFMFTTKSKSNERANDKVALVSYMLSTIILILLSQYYTLAGRISTLFATVEPVILFDILKIKFNNKLSSIIFIIFSLIIFIIINYSSGMIDKINYSFIF